MTRVISKKVIQVVSAAVLCVSVTQFFGESMDESVFTQTSCSEWGGILVEFARGDDSKSLALVKEQRIVKITAPNKKGTFEWSKISSFNFDSVNENQGVLSIVFKKNYPGTDKGLVVMGRITRSCWVRLRDNALGEIVFSEK